uniref:Uncharacterized protein n=1 Tax=Gallus gallus TaxID=9031 RepID=A0A8V1AIG6_CHICK
MDGAGVGTWRPHRPRGLISAQFPSPGPQYSIRGQQVQPPSPGREAHRGHGGAEQLPSLSPFCQSLLAPWRSREPGPGTYTLPRLMGPNTVYTSASPCYSVRGRSQRGRFDEDLAKVMPVDAYKTRAPAYTMAARPKAGEGKAAKPGPADYSVGPGKPQAPASTFGIRHSLYTTPLIVE